MFWDVYAPKPHDSRPDADVSRSGRWSYGYIKVIGREARPTWRLARSATDLNLVQDLGTADDAALAQAIGEGDKAALAEAFERHSAKGLSLAAHVMGSRIRAEEVVQDVFLRLWERPERFDSRRGTLRNFLLADVRGRAIDALRKDGRRFEREVRDHRRGTAVPQGVDLVALERVVAEDVRAAMSCLSSEESESISLAYFGGHSYREVAAILRLPEGTVKSRIRSGLARLRVHLAGIRTDDDR